MLRFAVAALAMVAPLAACPACGAGAVRSGAPRGALPTYAGHEADLFDDAIEPRVIGYELDRAPPPKNSTRLRERAQVGDAVVRARLTTITSKVEDRGRSWQIGFHTLERLAGFGPLEADFTVQVEPNGRSAGILRADEQRLVGMTFVAFVRQFARPGPPGESDLHFHLAPDERADIAAVRAAVTLDPVHVDPVH
jgi:hypothetical protein